MAKTIEDLKAQIKSLSERGRVLSNELELENDEEKLKELKDIEAQKKLMGRELKELKFINEPGPAGAGGPGAHPPTFYSDEEILARKAATEKSTEIHTIEKTDIESDYFKTSKKARKIFKNARSFKQYLQNYSNGFDKGKPPGYIDRAIEKIPIDDSIENVAPEWSILLGDGKYTSVALKLMERTAELDPIFSDHKFMKSEEVLDFVIENEMPEVFYELQEKAEEMGMIYDKRKKTGLGAEFEEQFIKFIRDYYVAKVKSKSINGPGVDFAEEGSLRGALLNAIAIFSDSKKDMPEDEKIQDIATKMLSLKIDGEEMIMEYKKLLDIDLSLPEDTKRMFLDLYNPKVQIRVLGEDRTRLGYPEYWQGAYLGKLTRCCQNLDGNSEKLVKHALTAIDSGFITILDGKKVLAQSCYWLSSDGKAIVLDSFESSGPENEKYMLPLLVTLQQKFKDLEVEILIGSGGNTPKKIFSSLTNNYAMRLKSKEERLYDDSKKVLKTDDEGIFQYFSSNPFIRAIKLGASEVVDDILKKEEIDPYMKDTFNDELISIAARFGNKTVMEFLLEKGLNIDTKDSDLNTPLILATIEGHTDMVELLLKNSADPNVQNSDSKSALILAVKSGNLKIVEKLLTSPEIDIDLKNKDNNTALIVAAKENNTDIVELLLKNGANPNIQNSDGKTPLIWAVKNGNLKIVEKLLATPSINIDIPNTSGFTPLIFASMNNHYEILELLLERGAKFNIRNIFSETALIRAVRNGNIKIVKKLLSLPGIEINIPNSSGETPLMIAARKGTVEVLRMIEKKLNTYQMIDAAYTSHPAIIEELLENDVDINFQDTYHNSVLSLAIDNGYINIVKKLLLYPEIEINHRNGMGYSPLMLASLKGYTNIVEILLRKGAEINLKNNTQDTPLILATRNRHTEIVEILLSYPGIDINHQNQYGETALSQALYSGCKDIALKLLTMMKDDYLKNTRLCRDLFMFAANHGEIEIIKKLLSSSESIINLQSLSGSSALMFACSKGHREIVELLLENGANVNLQNQYDESALQFAAANGNIEIVKLLLRDPRIDINLRDTLGNSALILAAQNGHRDIIQILLEKSENNELSFAAKTGNSEILEILLQNGADINFKDSNNDSLLTLAVSEGHINIVEKLLNTPGIKIDHKNNFDNNAFMIAVKTGRTEIIEMLLNFPGFDAHYALLQTVTLNNPRAVKFMLESHDKEPKFKKESIISALLLSKIFNYNEISDHISKYLESASVASTQLERAADQSILSSLKKAAQIILDGPLHYAKSRSDKKTNRIKTTTQDPSLGKGR